MRIAIAAVFCAALIVPSVASAGELSGVWTLPNGKKARIKHSASGSAVVSTRLQVGKRRVRLVFKGTIAFVKVGTTGGLGVSAHAHSFAIRHRGKHCIVKKPKLAVIGDLQNVGKVKHYQAAGYVSGYIHCHGTNTWTRWATNVGGVWSAPASHVASR